MNAPKSICQMLALLGVLFLAIGCALLVRPVHLKAEGVVTEGVIVGYVERGARPPTLSRVVRFTTTDGAPVKFTSRASSDNYSNQTGRKVQVIYLPDVPTDAEINDFQSLWLESAIFSGLGLLIAFICFSVLGSLSRKANKKGHGRIV